MSDLCRQDIEGTYVSPLPHSSENLRINLYCLTSDRILATVSYANEASPAPAIRDWAYLSFSGVDGSSVVLANFDFTAAARSGGSSKSIDSYMRLDSQSLLHQELNGFFTGRFMQDFLPLHAKRVTSFPRLTPLLSSPLPASPRVFVVRTGPFAGDHLLFDVLDGVPVINLVDKNGILAIHLTDGAPWSGDGLISMATAHGNGGESDDTVLYSLRGRFKDPGTIEFYMIIPQNGLEGPFTADARP